MSTSTLISDLITEMRSYFGNDERRIKHALLVLDNARRICLAEEADQLVVEATAVLHDIGIPEAERKYGSSTAYYQESEGPPVARQIMQNFPIGPENVDHICRIIANHHSVEDIDTPEFRVIWDADWLVNFRDEFPDLRGDECQKRIRRIFRTDTGRAIARRTFW